uniref:Uncharacterized protein n=2 Tax=Candidatus Kentrum sp. FM TaxID=2126340 RepID=A0A450T768_9GAMM|nr:MAG: hypothetical protein BECKFM1743C_GA0114222_102687 [Candidatus Kentron sp. FM]VFJ62351.1 MAG: hypothetical protein BECKFM1743A_GA0114220_103051 [Candidatus Kentron sp. FM]
MHYPSEIDMDGRMFGGEHLGSPLRSLERRGESCIRPYAQKLRLHRAILLSGHFLFFMYAFHAAISIRYWFAIAIDLIRLFR